MLDARPRGASTGNDEFVDGKVGYERISKPGSHPPSAIARAATIAMCKKPARLKHARQFASFGPANHRPIELVTSNDVSPASSSTFPAFIL